MNSQYLYSSILSTFVSPVCFVHWRLTTARLRDWTHSPRDCLRPSGLKHLVLKTYLIHWRLWIQSLSHLHNVSAIVLCFEYNKHLMKAKVYNSRNAVSILRTEEKYLMMSRKKWIWLLISFTSSLQVSFPMTLTICLILLNNSVFHFSHCLQNILICHKCSQNSNSVFFTDFYWFAPKIRV